MVSAHAVGSRGGCLAGCSHGALYLPGSLWCTWTQALNGFGPSAEPGDESKLPWALSIESTPSTWQVAVGQGNSAKELLEAGHGGW